MKLYISLFNVVFVFLVVPSFSFSMEANKWDRKLPIPKPPAHKPPVRKSSVIKQRQQKLSEEQELSEEQRRISEVSFEESEQALSEVPSERSRFGSENPGLSDIFTADDSTAGVVPTGRSFLQPPEESPGDDDLYEAAKYGRVEIVCRVLQNTHDRFLLAKLDTRDKFGITPLHLAIMGNHPVVVRQIFYRINELSQDNKKPHAIIALITASTTRGKTAFHFAADFAGEEIMQILLREFDSLDAEHQKDIAQTIKAQDHFGLTPLHCAARYGNREKIQMLLAKLDSLGSSAKALEVRDINGMTPLHYAAEEGHLEIAKLLLNRCSNACEVLLVLLTGDNEGNTLLHCAAMSGSVELVTFFLNKFDTAMPSKQTTIFKMALKKFKNPVNRKNYTKIAEKMAKETAVPMATIKKLKKAIKPIDEKNRKQIERLKKIINDSKRKYFKEKEVLKIKKNNLDRNAEYIVNYENQTPLHCAAEQGHKAVVELLLKRHSDPMDKGLVLLMRDSEGNTPFHFAARFGHSGLIGIFLHCSREARMLRNALETKNNAGHTVRDEIVEYAVKKNSGWESLRAIDAAINELRDEEWK